MIIPKLHDDKRHWDFHREFHWQVNTGGTIYAEQDYGAVITVFANGEVAVRGQLSPSMRTSYKEFNIALVSTTDNACPPLWTPDKVKIPQAWLNDGGAQTLLLDYCTGRAYSLDRQHSLKEHGKYRLNCGAIYPKNRPNPTAGPVFISPPLNHKTLITPEQRDHIETCYATCRAEVQLLGEELTVPRYYEMGGKLPTARLLAVKTWRELTPVEQYRLFHNGLTRPKLSLTHFELSA